MGFSHNIQYGNMNYDEILSVMNRIYIYIHMNIFGDYSEMLYMNSLMLSFVLLSMN